MTRYERRATEIKYLKVQDIDGIAICMGENRVASRARTIMKAICPREVDYSLVQRVKMAAVQLRI